MYEFQWTCKKTSVCWRFIEDLKIMCSSTSSLFIFQSAKSQWTEIFIISSVATLSTSVIYVIFASADVQWWNYYGDNVKSKSDAAKLEDQMSDKNATKTDNNPIKLT